MPKNKKRHHKQQYSPAIKYIWNVIKPHKKWYISASIISLLCDWGTVMALITLKGSTDMLFIECGEFMAGMQGGVAGMKRVYEVIDVDEENPKFLSSVTQNSDIALEMKDISFAYAELSENSNCEVNNILQNWSLSLKQNTLTALVGESGSGKSTIMKVLLGLYLPQSGEIYTKQGGDLRSLISYVPQDPTLFRGTVYENISLGNQSSTLEQVKEVSKMVGADEFIENLADGYQTILLDDGKSLSGGQRQRLAIARALLKDAPMLLLDEITSALDPQTERTIIDTIKEISKNRTVLFITHHSTVTDYADLVVNLNN